MMEMGTSRGRQNMTSARKQRPIDSELYEYPRYGYLDDKTRVEYFFDLDVTICPRCKDIDIFPGDRVCLSCLAEIDANER